MLYPDGTECTVRIAIFGATSRTGVPLTEQALAAGHDVVALVREPARRRCAPTG